MAYSALERRLRSQPGSAVASARFLGLPIQATGAPRLGTYGSILASCDPYARAVYASTDAYLTDLRDDALDQSPGKMPACVLNALLLKLSMRRGEIARLHAIDCHSPMVC